MANKKNKKITKDSKRRLIIFRTASLIIMLYFFITTISNIITIHKLNKQYNSLENELNILKAEEKVLKTDIEKLKDPDYLARYARENYSYSKDGEYVIKIEEKDEKKVSDDKYPDNLKYLIAVFSIIGLFFLTIIIINLKKTNTRKS